MYHKIELFVAFSFPDLSLDVINFNQTIVDSFHQSLLENKVTVAEFQLESIIDQGYTYTLKLESEFVNKWFPTLDEFSNKLLENLKSRFQFQLNTWVCVESYKRENGFEGRISGFYNKRMELAL